MKLRYFFGMILCLLLLTGCRDEKHSVTPTGYPPGEIDQPQVMYENIIYYYNWTGFEEELPDNYEQVGSVTSVDNIEPPQKNFSGSRVDLEQEIYALESEPNSIYIKYKNGFALFSASE